MTMNKKSFLSVTLATGLAAAAAQSLPPQLAGTTYRPDPMSRAYIVPKKVIVLNEQITNTDVLLELRSGQSEMGKRGTCEMTTTENDTASMLLDYGCELHGGLKLVLSSSTNRAPSKVRLRFGESIGEAMSESYSLDWKMGYSTNDHAMRDMVIDIPRDGQIEIGSTGFRYVRIDLLQPSTTIRLREATAILRYRDIPYEGSFRCNDERLNQIWMTGAYTVHLNMQEYLWDGIKRDRTIWLGDMHPEMATIMAVFGQNEVIPKSIDLACQQFPQPQWLNGMSAYSMWYLIINYEWYMKGGDMDFLRKHRDYIIGVIKHIDECVDEDGSETLASWRFLDWPSSPNEAGVESGYRALLTWALQDGEKLCNLLDELTGAHRCQDIARRLNKVVKEPNQLKQAAALMAIAGLKDAEAACQEVILPGGAKGFSTFYGYYMLQALAKAGHYQEALDIIRQYWGGMLDMGATTFWEDFDLDWTRNAARLDEFCPEGKDDIHGAFGAYCYPSYRHSFCHGWASGPTPWLSEHVLGITPLEPGCREVHIEPHLGDLQWAEGTYPTPFGVIKVRHEKTMDGMLKSSVEVPEGITVK